MSTKTQFMELLSKVHSPNTNLCVLLGAGASHYADLPLMGELTDKILAQAEREELTIRLGRKMKDGNHRNIEPLLTELSDNHKQLGFKEKGNDYAPAISFIERFIFDSVSSPEKKPRTPTKSSLLGSSLLTRPFTLSRPTTTCLWNRRSTSWTMNT